MFYYLFKYIHENFDIAGTGVFKYISFRSAAAAVLSLLITILGGKRLIQLLHKNQVKEGHRELGLAGQLDKANTPTMVSVAMRYTSI